jgi:hypothetical protein
MLSTAALYPNCTRAIGSGLLGLLTSFLLAGASPAQESTAEDDIAAIARELWALSPHADKESLAFTLWNQQGEIPTACAGCHSTPGFLDRIGADGTAPWAVDRPAPIGTTVECGTCHAPQLAQITEIPFPSGALVPAHPAGPGAACLTCHQGRESGDSVEAATAAIEGDDAISPDLRFINIHYAAAGATMFGAEARGGYEYPGQTYAGRFTHMPGTAATCTTCHDPHSTEVATDTCSACHGAVEPRAIRAGSPDIDGDGEMTEGVAAEIAALHAALKQAMTVYAAHVGTHPFVYAKGFPYFFNDLNGNGIAEDNERTRENAYNGFTPRLLRAAYNYQFVALDPGAWVHNPRYAAQLLHDSIADLAASGAPVEIAGTRP